MPETSGEWILEHSSTDAKNLTAKLSVCVQETFQQLVYTYSNPKSQPRISILRSGLTAMKRFVCLFDMVVWCWRFITTMVL